MSEFSSLIWALDGSFNKPIRDLSEKLRKRVENEFLPMPWDSLSEEQRRTVALQLDYQHDPSTKQDQKFWWNLFKRQSTLEIQIEQWESVATLTATDLAQKENRLKELRQEFASLELQQKNARGNYYPEKPVVGDESEPSVPNKLPIRYIPFPKAMGILSKRLEATPEELAAWLFIGPAQGGLAAYLNANELNPPPRFHFGYFIGNENDNADYIAPLMGCWFNEEDIANFLPSERYIKYNALIERWQNKPNIQPKAYIRVKIKESRLLDLHPIYGGTEESFPGIGSFPSLETGLFALSQIEEIEASDFAADEVNPSNLIKPFNSPPKEETTVKLVKKNRIDAMSVEIEEAIRELGKQDTPNEIMQKLKSYAQKNGSCITEVGVDFVLWRNGSGDPSKLDIKALRKRLARRVQKVSLPR